MAENTIHALQVLDNGFELNYIEKNGEILFTAEEIGKHLGYGYPAQAVHKLFRKNYSELKLYTTEAKLASVDGSMRETRLFTEEGVYILSMLARTYEAKKFRARVAFLLRRIRQEALHRQIELAREAALHEAGQNRDSILAEGARAALALTPTEYARVKAVGAYLMRGLSQREAATLLGLSRRSVQHYRNLGRSLGLEA